MVIHVKKIAFILKMHKPSVILLDSMTNKWRKSNKRTKVKFSFSEGETERCTKKAKGWLKHFDFILLDMICLQIAFLLAYVIRHDSGSPYIVPLYRNMAIFMELLDIIVMFFYETLSNVLKRGYFREFAVTVKHVLLVELFSVLYLFTMQEGQAYSISDRCDLCDSHLYCPDHLEKNSSKQDEWRKPFSVGRDDKRYGRAGRS